MNALLTLLSIQSWKPVLAALLLPPVPFLLLVLIGARLILPRRGLGWLVLMVGVIGLWLSTCLGVGRWIEQMGLTPPPALSAENVAELKAAAARQPVAVVVLSAGSEPLAPEYNVADLNPASVARLRYGLWLARETGAPLAFSGGLGWDRVDGQPEAQTAARVALRDFGQQIKWVEDLSRDTRENALRTVPLLKQAGIKHIVLVTHSWHMPRAQKMFEQAADGAIKVQPAPLGTPGKSERPALDWLPTVSGYKSVHQALRELLGLLAGA